MKLTGRTRHVMRKRFMRQSLVVLQVEEEGVVRHPDIYGCDLENYVTCWRDATPGDFDLTLKVQSDPE